MGFDRDHYRHDLVKCTAIRAAETRHLSLDHRSVPYCATFVSVPNKAVPNLFQEIRGASDRWLLGIECLLNVDGGNVRYFGINQVPSDSARPLSNCDSTCIVVGTLLKRQAAHRSSFPSERPRAPTRIFATAPSGLRRGRGHSGRQPTPR
jgi:hypothetical protein